MRAVSGVDTGTRGTTYFDAFVSRRSSYIGLASLEGKHLVEIQKIAIDIAVLGARGLDVGDSTVKYRLRAELDGLACIMNISCKPLFPR